MKITKISIYQVDLPLKEGAYSWSTQSFSAFDSTLLIVETDSGLSGVGEVCPLGPSYLPAYAEGARTGIAQIAKGLIGEDPLQLGRINQRMDELLKGHPYVKSAIDMACWDLLGKATEQPVYNLLGGLLQDKVTLFKVISRQSPEAMAAKLGDYQRQGFNQFQMKVGACASQDIERIFAVSEVLAAGNVLAADANTGWKQHEAIRVVKAVRDVDIYIEQPCLSYEECLAVRRHTDHPFILDECMDDLRVVMRGFQDSAMDVINLKVSRVGGLTRARQFRDLCVSLGITMTIEDSWGGEIATSALAHLAHSTPEGFHFQSSAFHEYHSLKIADGGPVINGGHMVASSAPGLGVTPDMSVLGKPVQIIGG
ncbi:cis-3-hydroxy-L-proline dehydratase [Pseudomonas botevensis]|uniref:cis-3-hydroxy-L-proline dehydratase n=1 Tax=Pseudomonas botevensis TaxID=2842352 RepID=UPI001C3D3B67|nr:cis-3-hydroxy-L-proline dehydratase [Pseudomonas botevensis]MBV4477645.1 mandelate racemase/muconate lactonizing enzyme family protein [Pseudomonas botevensis]